MRVLWEPRPAFMMARIRYLRLRGPAEKQEDLPEKRPKWSVHSFGV